MAYDWCRSGIFDRISGIECTLVTRFLGGTTHVAAVVQLPRHQESFRYLATNCLHLDCTN